MKAFAQHRPLSLRAADPRDQANFHTFPAAGYIELAMAGTACFSGRITTPTDAREAYMHVLPRQMRRASHPATAAPSQRLRNKNTRRQRMAVARAALAIPELGVRVPCAMTVERPQPASDNAGQLCGLTLWFFSHSKHSTRVRPRIWLDWPNEGCWLSCMAGALIDVQFVLQGPLKVDDVMTKKTLFSVREDTSIDEGRGLFFAFFWPLRSMACRETFACAHTWHPDNCSLSGLGCCRELLSWEVNLYVDNDKQRTEHSWAHEPHRD